MKTLGIIGGMGPEATNQLVVKIINRFVVSDKSTRPDILVSCIPVNLVAETRLITDNDLGNFSFLIVRAARRLESAAADFLVIACNTAHVFVDDVRKNVNIPVISAIEETINQVGSKRVGLIATSSLIENGLFVSSKFELCVPARELQTNIDKMLDQLAKGRLVEKSDVDLATELLNAFAFNGIESCILGCSELQLLGSLWLKFSSKITFFDTMDILANTAVNNLLN